ncbi:MAG TPA: hypothetical protein VLF59_03505 [Candidatus Saccharimonadales bacterium]|nr:hypothetical protein [Candidatus Saccharimonadales bacterium]
MLDPREAARDLRHKLPIEERVRRDQTLERYMRMHKVLVGKAGAVQLAEIHHTLKGEFNTERLSVAGWAAIESALMATDIPLEDRLDLFQSGATAWAKAYNHQNATEEYRKSYDRSASHRIALDMAVLPLFEGIIRGNVNDEAIVKAFDDCLMVAQSNANYLRAARKADDSGAMGSHIGLAYECNTLLAHNRKYSSTWFVVPTMERCDRGTFYRRQTHDLLVINQRYGSILSATPVEVKARGGLADQVRYYALLVQGKMHLSVPGKDRPEYTLHAIEAVIAGTASEYEEAVAEAATQSLTNLIRAYHAGRVLSRAASKRSVTLFRGSEVVREWHADPWPQGMLGQAALAA